MDLRHCENCKQQRDFKRHIHMALFVILLFFLFPIGIIYYFITPKACVICRSTNSHIDPNSLSSDDTESKD